MVTYRITDNKGKYIRKIGGRYSAVKSVKFADEWDQKYKAQNIIDNAIPKKERARYRVVAFDDGNILDEPKPPKVTTVKMVNEKPELTEEPKEKEPRQLTKREIHIQKVKEIANQEEDFKSPLGDWKTELEKFTSFVANADSRITELNEFLSTIDKEIVDIQHYIEFENGLNACQGYMAYKMLQKKLKRRRNIKNELHVLKCFASCNLDVDAIKAVQKEIELKENLEYTPRILTQLFD